MPMPAFVESFSRPSFFVSSAFPSPSIRILPMAPWSFPQAAMTYASLTETHQISSIAARVESVQVGHVAGHVFRRAGRRVRAGQPEQHDAFAWPPPPC